MESGELTLEEESGDPTNETAQLLPPNRMPSGTIAPPMGRFETLDAMYRREGRWAELAELLLEHSETLTEIEDQIRVLYSVAQLYESELADEDSAAQVRELIASMQEQLQEAEIDEPIETLDAEPEQIELSLEEQCALHLEQGQALRSTDVAGSIAAYESALELSPSNPTALHALAGLYEDCGAWDDAIATLARLVEQTKSADLCWRMGRIQANELLDSDAAETSYRRGLAFSPNHLPSMQALTAQYEQRGDWQAAANMMLRAEPHISIAVDKVRHLFATANLHMHELHDAQKARQLYAAVISIDPEHVDAGRPLAEMYFDAAQWPELSPVIEMLCRKVGHGDAELRYRAARCAEQLRNVQRANAHYKAAYELDPSHLAALQGRAELLFANEDWNESGKLYQNLLDHHPDDVALHCRLGAIRQTLGDRKKALAHFANALEIDPRHADALAAIVELHTQQGDWSAVVTAKRNQIESADTREQAKLFDEIGTIYHRKLQNAPKAAAAYGEALDLAPDSHPLLQKLLDLYIDAKQWPDALGIIERFIALEPDAFNRGKYFHAAATICRDELAAVDDAIDHYDCALDSFFSQPERLDEQTLPRALKSFEAIDKLLTASRDWKAQERAYRDMIKRLPQGDARFFALHVRLLDGLAEIYRSRLKQYGEATTAFELAQQLDPDNKLATTDRAEILAELYVVAGTDHAEKAIEQHARMLRKEPFKYDSYKALARIYKDTAQWDKHWCVCNALAFLRKADAEEQQFSDQYKPRGLVRAKAAVSTASWAKLADENRYISAVFSACWQSVAMMKAFSHKNFEIKREERLQLQADPFSKLFLYLGQVLNVPLPEVYLVNDAKPVDVQLANAIDKSELCPSFVVRPPVLQGKSERELAFALARRLTFMRPEYYLRMLLPTNTELKVVLLSAIVMLQPQFPVPPSMVAPIQQYLPEMRKRLAPHALEQLNAVLHRFIQATPEINLAKWGHAVDATSYRAGFVMCGALEVAARGVAAEAVVVDGPTTKDRVKDLALFAVSEDYFAVRAQMGVTIG